LAIVLDSASSEPAPSTSIPVPAPDTALLLICPAVAVASTMPLTIEFDTPAVTELFNTGPTEFVVM